MSYSITIPANGSFPLQAAGNKFHVFSATANFKFQFSWLDGAVGGKTDAGATMQFVTRGKKFKGINLYNDTGTAIDVVLLVFNDDIEVIDNRVSIESFAVTQDDSDAPWLVQPELLVFSEGDNSITIGTSEVALMAAAPTKKNRVTIWNSSGSLALYVGESGVTTVTGIYLGANERVVLEDIGSRLYGIRGSSSAAASCVVWEAS